MISIKELFHNFLKEHNALESYLVNLRETHIDNPQRYIGDAFLWPLTKEGTLFWFDLNNKWLKILVKNEQK